MLKLQKQKMTRNYQVIENCAGLFNTKSSFSTPTNNL